MIELFLDEISLVHGMAATISFSTDPKDGGTGATVYLPSPKCRDLKTWYYIEHGWGLSWESSALSYVYG
jgi:hypothetical protein